MKPILAPARRPCPSCPYRRDVPSGLWAREEYERLPPYDTPALWMQPRGVFMCHKHPARPCAGWCGCHDMDRLLGVRIAAALGLFADEATVEAVHTYRTDVPLFATGQAAHDHGVRDIDRPGHRAGVMIEMLEATRGQRARRRRRSLGLD